MLNHPQIEKMLGKLERFETTLYNMIFEKADEMDFSFQETAESWKTIPETGFAPIARGARWGSEGHYGWFSGCYTVPEHLQGKRLFLMPHIGCYEGLIFVNGSACGTIANKHQVQYTAHGNHYCDRIAEQAQTGEQLRIVLELYCGHYHPGEHPFSDIKRKCGDYCYDGADICVKNEEIQSYCFDLNAVRQLAAVLPESDFRRGEAVSALYQVHNAVWYDPDSVSREDFMQALRQTQPLLQEVLSKTAPDSAPFGGLTGHSHMDTAWLWHVDETIKKCARTYSNALNLMEQYPEYRFIQSSSCHSDFIRRYYPELFARIQQKVREGRYEPNGGVWVECDCNITSGESMIRQFLWGQRFTRKYFNYTSDVFWLPDTFGYSAAIPQIMRGCGCEYFMTTKLGWNDTNRFPYDSFYWEGIDGTRVLAHFNTTHHNPDVQDIHERFSKQISQPAVTNMKYLAYGYGDGGGGPTFEMIESARRCADLDGLGKTENMSASNFMHKLESTARNLNIYRGELYLELHRGTLTNQHTIKRNNRKSEVALHDLEYATVCRAAEQGLCAEETKIAPLYETLLMNQFHDILPGTCIHRAHVESRSQTSALIAQAQEETQRLLQGGGDGITLINSLSFDRSDPILIDRKPGCRIRGDVLQQAYTDLDGREKLILCGMNISAFDSWHLEWEEGEPQGEPFVQVQDNILTTPFARVVLNEKNGLSSFVDARNGRELKGDGFALNTFLMAEDVPCAWDNWDVDADIEEKFRDCAELIAGEVVSNGPCAYIIRSRYRISDKSTITQDMMFFRNTPEVRFDTLMDWQDDHRLLKACFDTSIREDFAARKFSSAM